MSEPVKDRRTHKRKPVVMQVKYRSLDTFFYDYALNISRGGIFIKTREPLEKGSKVEIEFDLPADTRTIRSTGQVVRVVRSDDDSTEPPGMGIMFEPLARDDLDLIETLWTESSDKHSHREAE